MNSVCLHFNVMELTTDFSDYIHQSEAKNTSYGTNTAYNSFKNYLNSINETRDIISLPPPELNIFIGNYFMHAKRKDGRDFEPDSLSTMHRGLARYLEFNKYPFNILRDEGFESSRKVLASKRKLLTRQGGGNKPNATRELENEEQDILSERKYFSPIFK